MSDHLITAWVAGPCIKCGLYVDGEKSNVIHICDMVFYCRWCCPKCNKEATESDRPTD